MQRAADRAQEWASKNNMKLNGSKTKEIIVYFGKKDLNIQMTIKKCKIKDEGTVTVECNGHRPLTIADDDQALHQSFPMMYHTCS